MTEKNFTKESALVDTNLLFYFFESSEMDKHLQIKEFMKGVEENSTSFFLSNQNLREFASISLEKAKHSTEKILGNLAVLRRMFFRILIEDLEDIEQAVILSKENNIPFWDALLASTALRHGIRTIYTEDIKDFERIPGIKAVNPLNK